MYAKNGRTNGHINGRLKQQPIAIFYEHPEWFIPMFADLDRRSVPYERQYANAHSFDLTIQQSPYALVFNRMSPSAHTRGHAHTIPYTLDYMAYLKEIGANVINGYDTYVNEFSKVRQISLLERLGICYPRARVINHPSQAPAAAAGLTFPVIVKANIGGSGSGITQFNTMAELKETAVMGQIDLGITSVALVQEMLPARDNAIIRVEVLDSKYLYAIRVNLTDSGSFNLCPADYCNLEDSEDTRPLIEGYHPPKSIIQTVERITRASQIEVGGVEYLINDRTGEATFYDINALSNFVADAPNVIGFDPFPKLVDFVLARAYLESTKALLPA